MERDGGREWVREPLGERERWGEMETEREGVRGMENDGGRTKRGRGMKAKGQKEGE